MGAIVASPRCFYAARAAGISASHFTDPVAKLTWEAGERALSLNREPTPETLIELGAPADAVVGYKKSQLGDVVWQRAVSELKRSLQLRSLTGDLHKVQSALSSGDIEGAVRIIRECADQSGEALLAAGVSAREFCAQPMEKPEEIISGLLYAGGTMMLSGPSKSRKTWSFMGLGLAVASGTPWLGFTTSKAPVIYLNMELLEYTCQKRLNNIARAMSIAVPAELHVMNLRQKEITIEALARDLPALIRTTGARAVIIDPWYKVAANSGAEENSNDGQTRILTAIERIVTGTGAALVIGHHFAKGNAAAKHSIDRAAGAGAMARWGDVIATLSEHEEKDAMTLEMHLRDFAPVDPVVLRWNFPLWVPDRSLNPTKLKKVGRGDDHPASMALEALVDGMTQKEWREKLGWSDSTMRRKRDELIAGGKISHRSGVFFRLDR